VNRGRPDSLRCTPHTAGSTLAIAAGVLVYELNSRSAGLGEDDDEAFFNRLVGFAILLVNLVDTFCA
jgi:hypothetical protein